MHETLFGLEFYFGDVTYGIRARVTALGPIWVQHVVRKHEDGSLEPIDCFYLWMHDTDGRGG